MFVITNWIMKEDRYEPNIPEDVGYLCIAGDSLSSTFGLFECEYLEDEEMTDGMQEVPLELSGLLESAKDFPPIIAIARDEMKNNTTKNISRLEFVSIYSQLLMELFRRFSPKDFLFERAFKSEIGYIHQGEYYWIVGLQEKDNSVAWVSRDYNVYHNSIDYFEKSIEIIKKHFT